MGRLSGVRQVRDMTRPVVVDPIPTNKPGVYVARSVSDVFVKPGSEFRLSDAHQSSQYKSEGVLVPNRFEMMKQRVPEVEGGTREYLVNILVYGLCYPRGRRANRIVVSTENLIIA
jgi:hypothetical protein